MPCSWRGCRSRRCRRRQCRQAQHVPVVSGASPLCPDEDIARASARRGRGPATDGCPHTSALGCWHEGRLACVQCHAPGGRVDRVEAVDVVATTARLVDASSHTTFDIATRERATHDVPVRFSHFQRSSSPVCDQIIVLSGGGRMIIPAVPVVWTASWNVSPETCERNLILFPVSALATTFTANALM